MRLERLEINGFKSFSDRSELAFDKGVTAIVGPNGCGKSNVADAITWVMGEQSAKSLRGERMEDVIFNGSDARKPTAAAEVRLRFSGVLKSLSGPAFPEEPATSAHDGNAHHRGNGNGHGNGYRSVDSRQSSVDSRQSSVDSHQSAVDSHQSAVISHQSSVTSPEPSVIGAESAVVGSSVDSLQSTVVTFPTLDSHGNGNVDEEVLIQSVAREVEVTRRLYRSGDSEYLIDGRICRLRDVHDLLMDTGLGAKAYAIIEQGKIGLILSSRPTDRRQLIEEAAGITKYKSRRRTAQLKLEAAQQNLTRVDDIVFEVDKQRTMLKRQAGKARRYQKLRDQLRRWEKVLFARKYRQLAETIESARGRLHEARDRESVAAARVSEIESDLGRLRIELVEAESRATAQREHAHACELAINRQQQQIAFDREQVRLLDARAGSVTAELDAIESRREPGRLALSAKCDAAHAASNDRDRAERLLALDSDAYAAAHGEIEGLEADVEAARSEVFSAINSATALRHALEHAGGARDRVAEMLSKLEIEIQDVQIEADRVEAGRASAADRLQRAREAMDATRLARAARESELASARIEHDWRARSVRSREQELAALEGRLESLAALEAARSGYSDGARAVLVRANGMVGQLGAVADYLEVDAGCERAVEACLGDLIQHVVVPSARHAAAGLQLLRDEQAGRCGFVIASSADASCDPSDERQRVNPPSGITSLASILRVNGPFADAIRRAIGDAWVAGDYDRALEASRVTAVPVATLAGDVFHGPCVVNGGGRDDARGILETKREIRELRERIHSERQDLLALAEEAAGFEAAIAQASNAVAALNAEQHTHEKAIVAIDAQLQRASEEAVRLRHKADQLARERQQALSEREALDRRQEEARGAIARLEQEQRSADERFNAAQHRLFGAREAAEDLSQRAAEARAAHAGLVERAAALETEVRRLEEAAAELDDRALTLRGECEQIRARIEELAAAIVHGDFELTAKLVALERLQADVRDADEAVLALRARDDEQEALVKDRRKTLESIRATVADLDIARATAESDLAHLSAACLDAVQATLDDVVVESEALEREGVAPPHSSLVGQDDSDDAEEAAAASEAKQAAAADLSDPGAAVAAAERHAISAEDAIATLRARIDRLGAVNMMAIEQFDELEARHTFLTTQRQDLIDSIAQTTEAIRRIDQTTRQRFAEAFAAINQNFQQTFSTLFGGGRAGLALLDENDPLESGIEIIAQPPGKRLQSVQLLSGGEKALTAIALMFGLFQYKPSPFCLLDEIDAPLDDANIGRFVEMLRGMQTDTQFILITHNRKTMEIADRLYGVTMEEPGVSKLISVNLN